MRIAVIPARGGSKRIPQKNIKLFRGKPIIAWTLETARACGCFDRIIVSTDNQDIAEASRQYGGEVPFVRPADLSGDHATTMDVIAHAVAWTVKQGCEPEAVCCMYATAPFMGSADIIAGLEALKSPAWDYAFSVAEYAAPVFRAFTQTAEGGLAMLHPEHLSTRSQDLPHVFHDAAQFYWGRTAAWLDRRPMFGHRSFPVFVPRWRVQDIDTPEDWYRAELIAVAAFTASAGEAP
jgi:N-acylneuraminate cytidylyltransferase